MSLFAPPGQPAEPEDAQPQTHPETAAGVQPELAADAQATTPAEPQPETGAPTPDGTPGGLPDPALSSLASAYRAPVSSGQHAYALPEPPRRRVSLLRSRTVLSIAAGSLLLGLAGGVGGAAAWDLLGPDDDAAGLPASPITSAAPPAEGTVAAVVEAAMPGVVKVESLVGGLGESGGSGFIIRSDGYILTNNHVVDGSDGEVRILMSDGTVESASIVGTSVAYDLAVLKVDRDDLVPLVLGDSNLARVGDPAIAIGSPLGLDSTVTTGIVSALDRPVTIGNIGEESYMAAIQTDAAINPGNSGGPLLNSAGEVIGVNSAVAALPGATSATGAGSVGLGFAIPANVARRVAEEIIADGTADVPVIGALLDANYVGRGVRVMDSSQLEGDPGVVVGSPADKAGIKEGEIIVAVNGRTVADPDAAIVMIRSQAPGDEVTLTVLRDEKESDIVVTLAALDDVDFGDATAAPEPSE